MSRPALASLALLLTAASSSAAAAQRPPDADHAAIAALIERTEAANNAGDVTAWVALFDDEFVYMPPGSPPVTDRAELVGVAEAGFRHRARISIDPVEIRILGDWAFARSVVTGEVTLADSGDVVAIDVKQIVIYHRGASGEWRIARLMTNSNGS